MDTPHKIPADKVDALAGQLKGSLKRRRPRTWLIVVPAMIVAIALLAWLAWYLFDQPQPPRLEVIAFDSVVGPDEPPRVTAQLAFPDQGDYAPSLLARRDVVFLDIKAAQLPGAGHEVKTTSDAEGRAAVDWVRPEPGKSALVIVRYVDAANKQGSHDQATLFAWARGNKVLLVDVEETLHQLEPGQVKGVRPIKIAPNPQAAPALHEAERRGYRVAYLAVTAATPLEYRIVRGWITPQQTAKDGVPAGPVLGRRSYGPSGDADQARRESIRELKSRFGDNLTFVTRTTFAASAGTANQVRVIAIEPGENLPGAVHVRGWAEVIPLLEKE
jgi:hypothetical protein